MAATETAADFKKIADFRIDYVQAFNQVFRAVTLLNSALVQTFPTPHGGGEACQPSDGSDHPGNGHLHLGHRPRGAYRALNAARRYTQTIGREAAPVWRNPRQREALSETRVPRSRPAPDGRQSGGTQPTDIRVINRRDD